MSTESISLKLSVLDIGPVRSNQTSGNAFESMIALAQKAEKLGFKKYWLAEHHNIPATAASIATTFSGIVAAKTEKIEVGGCVLLSNYSPFLVAEEAAILEACFPGRISLSIGGASGTDGITASLLQGGKKQTDYTHSLQDLIALLRPEGVKVNISGREESPHLVKATPKAVESPEIWIWGTNKSQAILAAEMGLPFMFCYHIMGEAETESIKIYLDKFQPSQRTPQPKVIASAIVVVGKTDEEAELLAKPQLMMMCSFRSGEMDIPQLLVEEVGGKEIPERHKKLESMFRKTWIIGSPGNAAEQIRRLAEKLDVDEIMINPVAAAYSGDEPTRAPNREFALEALAKELLKKN